MKPLIFVHVPKCAGSAVTAQLRQWYGNGFHVGWPGVRKRWDEFVPRADQFQYANGHIRGHFLDELQCDYTAFTFIRNPVDRMVSQYRYEVTTVSPPHKKFRKQFPTFESYAFADDPRVKDNFIARWLAGPFEKEPFTFEVFDIIDELYSFVGVKEHFNDSMRSLATMLEKQFKPLGKVNVTHKNEWNDFEISDETRQQLEEKHSLDMQIWNYHRNKIMNDANS